MILGPRFRLPSQFIPRQGDAENLYTRVIARSPPQPGDEAIASSFGLLSAFALTLQS